MEPSSEPVRTSGLPPAPKVQKEEKMQNCLLMWPCQRGVEREGEAQYGRGEGKPPVCVWGGNRRADEG